MAETKRKLPVLDKRMTRWLMAGFLVLMIGVFAAGAGAIFVFYHFGKGLPDYRQLATYNPPVMTRVYAGDGRLITEYAVEGRVFVPLEAIPRRVINAVVASEDQRFWSHPGVDPIGLTRAVFAAVGQKLIGSDRRMAGASSITQQVAQMFLIGREYSIDRKVREAVLSFRIEQAYTKEHIMELYLNQAYFGYASYGIASAAMNYFNKSLDELTIGEAAYLAGILKGPSNYNPARYPDAARDRRDYVIGRMQDDGYITRDEEKAARAEVITTRKRDETEQIVAEHFAEEVRRDLADRYGSDTLYKGGLAVRTSLDPQLQKLATEALRKGLIGYDRRHGWRGPFTRFKDGTDFAEQLRKFEDPAGILPTWETAVVSDVQNDKATVALRDGSHGTIPLAELRWARQALPEQHVGAAVSAAAQVLHPGDVVAVEAVTANSEGVAYPEKFYGLRQVPNIDGAIVALDPFTGRVRAMSGGFSYARSQFNRATQAQRQPGSSFKPFVYLAAMESGFTPSTLVLDAPFVMDQGPGLPKWKPSNYTDEYLGRATLRIGIEKSQNLMTVRLAQAVGMDKVAEVAESFGAVNKLPHNLAASLGAESTTVLQMVTAYGELVNGGKKLTPSLIDRIQDHNGKTIYKHNVRSCEACAAETWDGQGPPELKDTREQLADPASIYQVVHLLEGVVQYGTAAGSVGQLRWPLAGKTGTSNDARDVWFIGFSPNLVAGVFVGFDEPRSMGPRETGGSIAAPIFRDFIQAALKDEPKTPFRVPPGISLVRVNKQTGRPAEPGDARVILEAFKTGTSPFDQQSITSDADLLIDNPTNTPQQPAAGGLY
ncbi:MAG: penicillin-binding protein 1A [Proteobacteria bacterium]|nr:penicillin-binding protein 1A [Pseudomonadota bacterium]